MLHFEISSFLFTIDVLKIRFVKYYYCLFLFVRVCMPVIILLPFVFWYAYACISDNLFATKVQGIDFATKYSLAMHLVCLA